MRKPARGQRCTLNMNRRVHTISWRWRAVAILHLANGLAALVGKRRYPNWVTVAAGDVLVATDVRLAGSDPDHM